MVPSLGWCGRKEFNGGSEGFFYRKILRKVFFLFETTFQSTVE
jgi:hypothetical protein